MAGVGLNKMLKLLEYHFPLLGVKVSIELVFAEVGVAVVFHFEIPVLGLIIKNSGVKNLQVGG